MRHPLGANVIPDALPFGPNSPDPPSFASKSDPPAFGPNCVGCISTQNLADGAVTNPKLAPGTGHITFYTTPYGHDGWTVTNFNGQSGYVGPGTGVSTDDPIPTISGTDLSAITSSSIVIAQLHDSGMRYDNRADSTSDNPICNVWDVFTHGFHLYCNYGSANNPIIVAPSLQVAVINP
jgi:hypothetical protein